MSLEIDDFLARLNRKGTLNLVSESTRKAYRNTLEQFERFLDGQPTQELAQEWIHCEFVSMPEDDILINIID